MASQDEASDRGKRSLNRRNCLKGIGAAATSLAFVGTTAGGAAAAEYETVTLSEGESRQFDVGAGETFENVLIDVSASGADAQVRASGDGWTIRNVAVQGRMDVHKNDGFWGVFMLSGDGTVENCYLGDGSADGRNKAGIGAPSGHSGQITVRNCYVAHWADNGIYSSHTAEGGGGTMHVQDCYFHDNNIAHLRIASDGSVAERCVVHNTNEVPTNAAGDVHSKGVYTGYGDPGQTVEIRDCHFEVTSENTNGDSDAFNSNDEWHSEMSTVHVSNTEYVGSIHGPFVELGSDNGENPDLTPPSGVPTSAEAAASGVQGSDGSDGNDDGDATTRLLTIEGTGTYARYDFAVSGTAELTTDGDATINPGDKALGTLGSGAVIGGRDSFAVTGEVTDFIATDDVVVSLDGEEVDPASLGRDMNVLTIENPNPGTWVRYRFTVDGTVQRSDENEATIDAGDAVEGRLASGLIYNGRDSFAYTGSVTGFSADDDVVVYRNGEEVDFI